MQDVVRNSIENNKDAALILIDIGVWSFRDLLEKYPQRVKNIGIFEPGIISVASGLSLMGITPTIYGISPFIVQRALEQLKLDFIYQNVSGNFITTGAAYDFSSLGYSHYCPEDIATLYQLPGMDLLTPSTPSQFKTLWEACAFNGNASYYRMTDYCSISDIEVEYGKATIVQKGTKGVVIAVAEMLDAAIYSCKDKDVTLLYYSTIQPFDSQTLRDFYNKNIFICEPFYQGTMTPIIMKALTGCEVCLTAAGVPREVLRNYGTKMEKDVYCGLSAEQINNEVNLWLSNIYL